MWFKIVVSCLPAAVIGLAFNDWIEAHLMNYVVVALMLIIYGVLFIVIEITTRRELRLQRKSKNYLEKCTVYRCFPAPFHRTGNFPFGGNHHRRYPAGMLERARIGVHVFPCRSGYVRREPFKTGKTRLCLYRC